MIHGIDFKKVVDSVCRKMCPPQQPPPNTVTFTDEEASLIMRTRQRLRQWLDLAQAGVIGAPMQGDLKSAIMEIISAANRLYEWYVPPFSLQPISLTEGEISAVVSDMKSGGGMQGWLRLDGTYYTTNMDTFKKIVDWDWTDTRKYLVDTFDCLLPDTPIIYKDPVTGAVDIAEVQELPPDGGFYALDMNVDDGSEKLTWTRVNWVRPKHSSKKIITISAPEGFIQVTEDHRFWIRQRWCRIGKFVHVDEGRSKGELGLKVASIEKVFSDSYELDPDLAWVYGLFLAEGHAAADPSEEHVYGFHIDMADESALLKAKK